MNAAEAEDGAQLCWTAPKRRHVKDPPPQLGKPPPASHPMLGFFDVFADASSDCSSKVLDSEAIPSMVQVHDMAADDICADSPPSVDQHMQYAPCATAAASDQEIQKLEQDDNVTSLPLASPTQAAQSWADVPEEDADFSTFRFGCQPTTYQFEAIADETTAGVWSHELHSYGGSFLAHARATLPDVYQNSDASEAFSDVAALSEEDCVEDPKVEATTCASSTTTPLPLRGSGSPGTSPGGGKEDSSSTEDRLDTSSLSGLLKVSTPSLPVLPITPPDEGEAGSECRSVARPLGHDNSEGAHGLDGAHQPSVDGRLVDSYGGRLKDFTSLGGRIQDFHGHEPRLQVPLKDSHSPGGRLQDINGHEPRLQDPLKDSSNHSGRLKDYNSHGGRTQDYNGHEPRLGPLKDSYSHGGALHDINGHEPRLQPPLKDTSSISGRLKDSNSHGGRSQDFIGHIPRQQVPSKDSCSPVLGSTQAASAHSQPCAVESSWDFEGYTIFDLDEAGQFHKPHVPCASSELDVALVGMKDTLEQLIDTASEPTPSLEVRLARLQQYADATWQFELWIQGLTSPSPHPVLQPSVVQVAAEQRHRTRRRKGKTRETPE